MSLSLMHELTVERLIAPFAGDGSYPVATFAGKL